MAGYNMPPQPGLSGSEYDELEQLVANWRNGGSPEPIRQFQQGQKPPHTAPMAQTDHGIPATPVSNNRWSQGQVGEFNQRFNAAGPRVISGKDRYAGAVYQQGESRGMTEGQFSQHLQRDISARGKRTAALMRTGDTLPNGKKSAARQQADQSYQSFYAQNTAPKGSAKPASADHNSEYKRRSRNYRF